jgi:hypothetical protein
MEKHAFADVRHLVHLRDCSRGPWAIAMRILFFTTVLVQAAGVYCALAPRKRSYRGFKQPDIVIPPGIDGWY